MLLSARTSGSGVAGSPQITSHSSVSTVDGSVPFRTEAFPFAPHGRRNARCASAGHPTFAALPLSSKWKQSHARGFFEPRKCSANSGELDRSCSSHIYDANSGALELRAGIISVNAWAIARTGSAYVTPLFASVSTRPRATPVSITSTVNFARGERNDTSGSVQSPEPTRAAAAFADAGAVAPPAAAGAAPPARCAMNCCRHSPLTRAASHALLAALSDP